MRKHIHLSMNRVLACLVLWSLIAGLACACGTGGQKEMQAWEKMPAMIRGGAFCLAEETGAYTETFLNGVNIGAASAGNFPGEFGIDRETYLRWFQYIGDMNVRVIRVYVNQMPAFYEALLEYNRKADAPLYLLHGVYANEDLIDRYGNAFQKDFQASFLTDIRNAVDMIHGSAEIEKLPGNAGGSYTADVSPWVIGWILGIEWTADFVNGTNAAAPDKTSFSGSYVRTEQASPFEVFLAEAAETAIARDVEEYGSQRPVALCNWCTTDPLDHPNEPSPEMEDAAVVDTEHIRAAEGFSAGFFASYHVYPYYPEFLSYDTKYLQDDPPNPYLSYLKELTAYHSMPVLISEYGIPASRGVAHRNAVTGMSQGAASEEQQALWLMSLNRDIRAAGCCGGLIFTWQDEWFKRSWNTMDYELPDRRPFWYNVQCPEECFGLLAFEPGEKEASVTVDGDRSEWKKEKPVISQEGLSVYARCDAAYLYLLVEGEDWDFRRDTVYLPLGVTEGAGSDHTDTGLAFSEPVNYLLRLRGEEDSCLLVEASCDLFQYTYAHLHSFFEPLPGQYERNSGHFNPVYLAMNRPMLLPETGQRTEFMREETGRLRYGDSRENSLADFCAGDGFVEIRLPWQLIGFMDPSTKQAAGDLIGCTGDVPAARTQGVRLGVLREGSKETAGLALFTWEDWELPVYHERLKASYWMLRDYFAEFV